MAITNAGIPTAAKDDALGVFSSGRTYKVFLVAAGANWDVAAATTYAALAGGIEHAATGSYVAGGLTLAGYVRTISGGVSFIDFTDPQWSGVTVSADGIGIYATDTGRIVYGAPFVGGTKGVTGGNFPVTFPAADASNALIRAA